MEITIKITGEDVLNHPEVMESVKALSMTVSGKNTPATPNDVVVPSQAPAPISAQITAAPMQSTGVPTIQMQTQAAPVQSQVMQSPAPTAPNPAAKAMAALCGQNPIAMTAPTAQPAVYTLEQLSLAAAPLMDAGKTDALVALMQSFGVQALQQLPQEKYNDFAVAIRGMGAQI